MQLDIVIIALGRNAEDPAWASVYPSIIDAAERDPEIAALQAGLHKAFMPPFHAAVEQAKDRGEVQPEKSAAEVTAAVVGPLFYRRWFSKEAIDDRFIENTIDGAVKAALGR
ncbi:TetR-like C-terminal domain-containing protein [Bordetella genomosp. 9]|nr:TetR-like C-terminal domain-containing protein [Bordetella genomosp. 9]